MSSDDYHEEGGGGQRDDRCMFDVQDDEIERHRDGPRAAGSRQRGAPPPASDAEGAAAIDPGAWRAKGIDVNEFERHIREACLSAEDPEAEQRRLRQEFGYELPQSECPGCCIAGSTTEVAYAEKAVRDVVRFVAENLGRCNDVALFVLASRRWQDATDTRDRTRPGERPSHNYYQPRHRRQMLANRIPPLPPHSPWALACESSSPQGHPAPIGGGGGGEEKRWNAATMYAHFMRHSVNSHTQAYVHTKELRRIEETILQNSILRVRRRPDGEDEVVVDKEQAALLFTCKKMRMYVDARPIAKNLFADPVDPKSTIDLASTGKLMPPESSIYLFDQRTLSGQSR